MNNQLGRDLISDLPLGIIENILIHVPIREAIRTSILSTKWRHKWTSLPHLDFEEYSMGYKRNNSRDEYAGRIQNFVSRTLFRHQGLIHRFRLDDLSIERFPETDEWLLLLSRKDIKELILGVVNTDTIFFVPSSLYSCQNLTYLELYGCEFGSPPPTFKGFLCLRTLILQYVEARSGAVESLVAHSPLLEKLNCTKVECSELRISAPNLKYVFIESDPIEISVCTPLLDEMVIILDNEYNDTLEEYDDLAEELLQQKGSFCNYTKFLGGVTNLESLTGSYSFTKFLSIGIEYGYHPLVFHRLKDITLSEVNFTKVNETLVVIRLIMGAPNLHSLQVEFVQCNTDEDEVKGPIDLWNSECPQNWVFEKLKFIKLKVFRGMFHEMKFIKFLLETSLVLETIIIELGCLGVEKKLKLAVTLLGYCRASTSAKILFK